MEPVEDEDESSPRSDPDGEMDGDGRSDGDAGKDDRTSGDDQPSEKHDENGSGNIEEEGGSCNSEPQKESECQSQDAMSNSKIEIEEQSPMSPAQVLSNRPTQTPSKSIPRFDFASKKGDTSSIIQFAIIKAKEAQYLEMKQAKVNLTRNFQVARRSSWSFQRAKQSWVSEQPHSASNYNSKTTTQKQWVLSTPICR